MDQVAALSEDVQRVKALGIIIVALNIEQNAGNATGNVMVSQSIVRVHAPCKPPTNTAGN